MRSEELRLVENERPGKRENEPPINTNKLESFVSLGAFLWLSLLISHSPILAVVVVSLVGPTLGSSALGADSDADQTKEPIIYDTWETFTTKDGLPHNKIFSVAVDGRKVWFGTENGLARYDTKRKSWKVYNTEDGLAHRVVSAIAIDDRTGDLWLATFGGLNRFSAGRFDTFDQMRTGLLNDVVYGVAVQDQNVWIATAAGLNRYNTYTDQWDTFTEGNTQMHERWCYNVCYNDGMVFVAVWGGGVLEYDVKRNRWKDYVDPDGETELDLFKNDGLVHDITSACSFQDGLLWVGTYFGLSTYDGRHWKTYMDHDSGLVSNFVNFVKAKGPTGWICTDRGLSSFDGQVWITYRKTVDGNGGEIKIYPRLTASPEVAVAALARAQSRDAASKPVRILKTETSIADNFVQAVDFQSTPDGDCVWVGTSKGVSRGTIKKGKVAKK